MTPQSSWNDQQNILLSFILALKKWFIIYKYKLNNSTLSTLIIIIQWELEASGHWTS